MSRVVLLVDNDPLVRSIAALTVEDILRGAHLERLDFSVGACLCRSRKVTAAQQGRLLLDRLRNQSSFDALRSASLTSPAAL